MSAGGTKQIPRSVAGAGDEGTPQERSQTYFHGQSQANVAARMKA